MSKTCVEMMERAWTGYTILKQLAREGVKETAQLINDLNEMTGKYDNGVIYEKLRKMHGDN